MRAAGNDSSHQCPAPRHSTTVSMTFLSCKRTAREGNGGYSHWIVAGAVILQVTPRLVGDNGVQFTLVPVCPVACDRGWVLLCLVQTSIRHRPACQMKQVCTTEWVLSLAVLAAKDMISGGMSFLSYTKHCGVTPYLPGSSLGSSVTALARCMPSMTLNLRLCKD